MSTEATISRKRGHVILETTPLSRPGAERGLGRYVRAVEEAVEGQTDVYLERLAVKPRRGRSAEFRDLLERRLKLMGKAFTVFHATNPYVATFASGGRYVASILDVIPLDLPEHTKTGAKARFFYRLAARADRVLTLSEHAASRIETTLGVSPSRVTVAPLPPARSFGLRTHEEIVGYCSAAGITSPYCAVVADLDSRDPRKRNEWLPGIAANLRSAGVALVVAGGNAREQNRSGMRLLGRIEDRELACLYAGALSVLSTSAYEGQGLPAVEAMACGTPVIAMSNSAIPEVVGAGGILVDERNDRQGSSEVAQACLALESNPGLRAELSGRAIDSAARFTRDRFAAAIAQAYFGE